MTTVQTAMAISHAAPAVLGGERAIRCSLPTWPQHSELEAKFLREALESDIWWSVSGKQVRNFEASFASYHGVRYALGVTNGTHALELALRVLRIGPGDEVIIPALTFIATAIAVFIVGATPVPVDVDPETWCLDPEAVRAAITPRTRAMIPVHFAGHLADMDALLALSTECGIPIIEDAAHAHGASSSRGFAGSFGLMGAFSFQNFKLMTAGEGGMFVTSDAEIYKDAVLFANCGRPIGDTRYEHKVLGSNYRMCEFQGAVLNAQLTRLAELGARREENAARLTDQLREIEGVKPQVRRPAMTRHARYMYVFTVDSRAFCGLDRQTIVDALVAEGVPAFRMYPPVQDTECFRDGWISQGLKPNRMPATPVSTRLAEDGIWIHHRALLADAALVDQIALAVAKVHAHAVRLRRQKVLDNPAVAKLA